jgi:hypothetical protein
MAERMGLSGWSAVIGTWVTILGGFGGGFAALNTYSEEVAKMEDARVVQTFALFEMFNSTERLQARAQLFAHTKNGAELNANALYVVLDFYDALQICVERNLCDSDLAVRLFQSYAVPFWDSLGETITASRTESDPRFGAGLEWMAGMPRPGSLESDTPASAASEASTEAIAPAPETPAPE